MTVSYLGILFLFCLFVILFLRLFIIFVFFFFFIVIYLFLLFFLFLFLFLFLFVFSFYIFNLACQFFVPFFLGFFPRVDDWRAETSVFEVRWTYVKEVLKKRKKNLQDKNQ